MMRRPKTLCSFLAGMLMILAGCESSSHLTHHTYEYSDQGRAEHSPTPSARADENRPSDYQMTSPGEMKSPGDMTSPGRPVVEPRRNP